MPGNAEPPPIRSLIILHLLCAGYFFAWVSIASLFDHPVSVLSTDAVSAVESSLREVQQHPEEGIHALARIQLPPYTGILHTSIAMLWAIAAAFALGKRATWPMGVFAILMLQEGLFLSSERLPHAGLLWILYFAALVAALWGHGLGRGMRLAPKVFLFWLLVRTLADSVLSPTLTPIVECFAELQAAALFVFVVGGGRILPGAINSRGNAQGGRNNT